MVLSDKACRLVSDLWRWAVIAAQLAVLAVVSVGHALHFTSGNEAVLLALLFTVFGYYVVGVVVHELGHAFAAWLAGWRVHLIMVWRIGYAPKRKRFQRVIGQVHRDVGGAVLATPSDPSHWDRRAIPYLIGGAAANFLFGIFCVAAAAIGFEAYSDSFVWLVWLGELSFILGVANLVPVWRPGHWQNDGARLMAAMRGQALTPREQLIARLAGLQCDRAPLEDWNETVRELQKFDLSNDTQNLDPLLFGYAFGSADLVTAKILLQRILDVLPHQDIDLLSTQAFIAALLDRDAERASAILDELPRRRAQLSFSYWRARIVSEFLLGNRAAALEAIGRTRELARKAGASLDQDDEALFQAVDRGEDLPSLPTRPGYVSLAPFLEQRENLPGPGSDAPG